MKCARRPLLAAIAVVTIVAFLPGLVLSSISGIRLSRAKTKVGLANVYLETSDLALAGSELTGAYSIRVPLAPWKDDHGRIRLTTAPDVLSGAGGKLSGSATSEEDGRIHSVECTLDTEGNVGIVISGHTHTLTFAARYEGLTVAATPAGLTPAPRLD